jgi:hypothetical protein
MDRQMQCRWCGEDDPAAFPVCNTSDTEQHQMWPDGPVIADRSMMDEIDTALLRLNDAICSRERATRREYTLLLIPHSREEPIQASVNGKPAPADVPIWLLVGLAVGERT